MTPRPNDATKTDYKPRAAAAAAAAAHVGGGHRENWRNLRPAVSGRRKRPAAAEETCRPIVCMQCEDEWDVARPHWICTTVNHANQSELTEKCELDAIELFCGRD